jgi:hypothetical protein
MTGKAAPDVEIYQNVPVDGVYYYTFGGMVRQPDGHLKWERQWFGGYPTHAAALAAARAAAGFGHVDERPCHSYDWPVRRQGADCTRCAWPRDAHGTGGTE